MEGVDVILSALMAGALTGTQATANQAILDTYQFLKTKIQNLFTEKTNISSALEQHEKDPGVSTDRLKEMLLKAKLYENTELIEISRHLLRLIETERNNAPKFHNVINGNIEGFIQGDNSEVHISFGSKLNKKKGEK